MCVSMWIFRFAASPFPSHFSARACRVPREDKLSILFLLISRPAPCSPCALRQPSDSRDWHLVNCGGSPSHHLLLCLAAMASIDWTDRNGGARAMHIHARFFSFSLLPYMPRKIEIDRFGVWRDRENPGTCGRRYTREDSFQRWSVLFFGCWEFYGCAWMPIQSRRCGIPQMTAQLELRALKEMWCCVLIVCFFCLFFCTQKKQVL